MPPTLRISEKYVKINEELMSSEIQDKENIHSDHEDSMKSDEEDEEIDVETVTEDLAKYQCEVRCRGKTISRETTVRVTG